METQKDLETLTKIFAQLGARDPESWAESQIENGIPQLARFLFLRQAWRSIVEEGDASWIDEAIERAKNDPSEPYAGGGHALVSLKAKGATDDELTDLVRAMQAKLLFSFCYLLEDPGDLEEEIADVGWALVEVDDEDNIISGIPGLHESVLEMDPTGREMRPRRFE
jgi:hypothetical protein